MREIVHVKLDMLNRISFGHREHIIAMLEAAQVEIQEWLKEGQSHTFSKVDDEVFDGLHKLKTTFAMLGAGRCVQMCQVILDQKGELANRESLESWNGLLTEAQVVLADIHTFLKEGWD